MAGRHTRGARVKRNRIWPVLAAVVGMVLVFAACSPKETEHKPTEEPMQTRPEKVENDEQQMQQEELPEDDVISTVYGELSYPGMWTDRVWYEVAEDGADVQIIFYAQVEQAETKIFALCYGTVPEDGFEMGTLLVDGDMLVPVSTVMYPIVPEETWSEETTNEILSLQESVNDLYMQLQENPDFTPANQ